MVAQELRRDSRYPAKVSDRAGFACDPSDREVFRAAARALAREIADRRVYAKDGSVTWRRPNRSTAPGAPPLVAAGPHLYDGVAGIAVLFAALGRVEADDAYCSFSLEIIAPLRLLLARLAADPARARSMRLGIGGLVGLNSLVYAFVTLGRLLDLPGLVEEAHQICSVITPDHVAADTALDVVSGAPGAILALLALTTYRAGAANGTAPLALAEACADHLLSRRLDRPDGSIAWSTDAKFPPLTGFAHGSTGIACALLKLHARTGRRALQEAALRAWAFERSTYSAEHQDWIDQTSPTLRFLNQWCFGAPGIALGRLATLDLVEDEEVWADIRTALRITSAPAPSKTDHICCGDMGRVDVLLYAAEKLREPELYDTACDIALRVLAKARAHGRFEGLVRSRYRDPSLFSGESGVAYTLLRLVHPAELPCLLAME